MDRRWGILMVLMLGMQACGGTPTPAPGQTPTPEVTATEISAVQPSPLSPVESPAAETVQPSAVPSATVSPIETPGSSDDLIARVQAGLPNDAYEALAVLPLAVPEGDRPLWAVFSYGELNYRIMPRIHHFVMIYTWAAGDWQELDRLGLDEGEWDPEIVGDSTVKQVRIDSTRIWLQVNSRVGISGGLFQLLSFDGSALRLDLEVWSAASSAGGAEDLNGDGVAEVLFDEAYPFVFCDGCRAVLVSYQIFRWDRTAQQWSKVEPIPLDADQPEAIREPVNRAVALAEAGLWKDAQARMAAVKGRADELSPAAGERLLWNGILIEKIAADRAAAIESSGFPVLNHVFYGDYPGAVKSLQVYTPDALFTQAAPPLTQIAEGNGARELGQLLIRYSTKALAAEPELAEAYFLRGWGEYWIDPDSPEARADFRKAAELRPEDPFLVECAAYFK